MQISLTGQNRTFYWLSINLLNQILIIDLNNIRWWHSIFGTYSNRMVPYIYYEDATEGFWGTTCNNELVTRVVSPVFRKKNYKMGTLFHRKELFQKHFKTNAN